MYRRLLPLPFVLLAPSLAWAAPVVVAVEQGSSSTGTAAAIAAQLNDDTYFDFTATVVTASQIDSAAELAAYNVVIFSASGSGARHNDWTTTMAAAVKTFVSNGGGVVSAGWVDYDIISTTAAGADLDEVIPIDAYPDSNNYFCYGTLGLSISSTPHEVTTGISTFSVTSADIEINPLAVDTGATVLGTATGTCTSTPAQALVVDDYGLGRTVYLGLLYGASTGYNNSSLRVGSPDRLLEQAVNWAAKGSCTDADGDGYGATSCGGTDCDDTNAAINTAAQEVCDSASVDEDCDGLADDKDSSATGQTTWYADTDGDTYGGTTSSKLCDQPSGYVSNNTDCNDANKAINPGAQEVCDSTNVDEDCDGLADDNDSSATGQTSWYADTDGDSYGGTTSQKLCDQPTGYVSNNTDCNDTNKAINPGAQEVCDSTNVDEDCDGLADDKDSSATGQTSWYADTDGDNYGGPTSSKLCDQPTGSLSSSTDCDDTNAAVNPGATELCNQIDDNCDGQIDENSASNVGTWYADADGDSFGDVTVSVKQCSQPSGYVRNSADCDDTSAANYPGADEYCDGVDNDCNGILDDDAAIDALIWYADTDGDSFGDPAETLVQCYQPTGYVGDSSDCDDSDALVYPNATEFCNGIDDNCDTVVDENSAVDAVIWYADADGDTYGDASSWMASCSQPTGYEADDNDCNDQDAAVFPGAAEYCNGMDDNCDGTVDENSAMDAATWYADVDGDGFGDKASSTVACSQPTGTVADASDCDDTDGAVFPGAAELCNGIDDNCDGTVDENSAVDASTWYLDQDGDGYGDSSATLAACSQPTGYGSLNGDCNDADPAYNPGATEACDDPNDYNCDGSVGYTDTDADGFAACKDCDDSDASINTAATETCNGVDDNCDGLIDDSSATGQTTYYGDQDGDGFGRNKDQVTACTQPTGYVLDGGDCDDSDVRYNPAATESCDDPNDYNCDGSVGYADKDQDGFAACQECDDGDATINPMQSEVCNGLDDNCDGVIDTDATDQVTYYLDEDGDGYGDEGSVMMGCDPVEGYSDVSGDCNDSDVAFYPGAPETCEDKADYNCDGSVGFEDADQDGVAACKDCNDADPTALPGGAEVCDGIDNDCNGAIDDEVVDSLTWFEDADGDSFGSNESVQEACNQPDGFVENNADCADNEGTINPDAEEQCGNDVDDNCDGEVDEACKTDTCGCAAGSDAATIGLFGVLAAGLLIRRRKG